MKRQATVSKAYAKLLNMNRILKKTQNKHKLKVTLKKTFKGNSLFATMPIRKGELIAYYKVTVFKVGHNSPTNNMYTFDIYTKSGNTSRAYIGDIDLTSFPDPLNGISYWAPFANEPSEDQTINAEIKENLKWNYRNKKRVNAGHSMVYNLVATRYIKKGEEIVWYYGKGYARDYKVNVPDGYE